MLTEITPLILTLNEAPNIGRTLDQLYWATQIIVVDSGSEDATLDILQRYPQVQVFHRRFDTHANQWNFGLEQVRLAQSATAQRSGWVLSLDADYVVTDELIAEIKALPSDRAIDGYFVKFKYCVFGKPLRGTLLPPRQALFRYDKAVYIDDGHTQLLQLNGHSETLTAYLHHDDRKPLSRWLWAQDRYMLIEVKKLRETPAHELSLGDRIRQQKLVAPLIILIYCLILKGGVFDGWQGWYYAFQRVLAELLLSIRLIESEYSARCLISERKAPASKFLSL